MFVQKAARNEDKTDVTFSQEVIEAIAKAESGRLSKERKDIDKDEMDKYLAERMVRLHDISNAAFRRTGSLNSSSHRLCLHKRER